MYWAYVPHVSGSYAMSNSCLIFFLIDGAVALLIFFDAARRDLSPLTWAFISFMSIPVGTIIYVLFVVFGGYTSLHLRKSRASEEVMKKWEDTESTLDMEKQQKEVGKRNGKKAEENAERPYRVK